MAKKRGAIAEFLRRRHLPKQLRKKDKILTRAVKEIEALDPKKDNRTRRTKLAQKNAGDTDISGMMTKGITPKKQTEAERKKIAAKQKAIAKRTRALLARKKK